ncbi:hypothetical protein [Sphingomonas sp.]|uniref:hypothetical protein n=1 Tax=Sphingomonas sp. TaxID=28214 RepID=UPI002C882DA3|nr:hypothetical protein [Sphingomonas sp.]HTG39436.1 hypothetical protein [Sphingomonas sp.]
MMQRPLPDLSRNAVLAAGAGIAVAAAGIAALGWAMRRRAPEEGHAAPDLPRDGSRPDADRRAPVDFRPDPTAPVSAAEREALRPATGPSPTLVNDRGAVRSQP